MQTAKDMESEDWKGLVKGLVKFFAEEAQEPEHSEDELAMDPPVSEAQRKAMFAAAAGKSNIGIPQKVGEEFSKADKGGKLPEAKDMNPKDWRGLVGGLVKFFHEESEEPYHQDAENVVDGYDAPTREQLETQVKNLRKSIVALKKDPANARRVAEMQDEIKLLEHDISRFGIDLRAMDSFAMDKSVRSYDADDRLHVALANISKANICPYYGHEIPDFENMGLDRDRKYQLFRAPEELKKAATTFNNIPLLNKHVPVSAEDYQPDLVVGSTGTDANFDEPYLTNSLVVWAKEAIEAIENEQQRQLSCAYRYRADMTPGTYMGEAYDGIMRDIIGNHVALVEEGRAGSDVVVGDSQISRKDITMGKKLLSRKAAMVGGAISTYLLPKLAQDARVDLLPMLSGVTSKNFKSKKADIVNGVLRATKGQLANDASLEDLTGLLDHLEDQRIEEGADAEMEPMPIDGEKEAMKANDEEEMKAKDKKARDKKARDEEAHEFLKSKLSAEDMSAYDDMYGDAEEDMKAKDAESERAEENAEGEVGGGGMDDAEEGPEMKPITKKAMDSALKAQRESILRETREAAEAREFVAPWVGKLSMALDSSTSVYKTALDALGVRVKDVHPSAYRAILEAQPKPGSSKHTATIAQDSVDSSGFAHRFGNADRIGILG